ncbi:LacI family DNA-binding transcriptional regulator [Kocuria sp.]|uniref:LacI family DNA-binding transcriptional regulator n=1 Tax=Kocuria sp. TaxID=1871328 RepID=UPI0026DB2098|nr:LacI family DNA-binding transcriptional regulator [Kocuria sp.]MDO4918007.1 LacI family DNA-binding transcriptional regulator [Kocuria sp.]
MTATRTTMADVARAAGLSISSVSNAYNRSEKLSPATRERVLGVAASLGYAGPDPTARNLRRRRTGGVGVVFTDDLAFAFSDPASSGFLAGMGEELMVHGNHLVLLPTGTPDHDRLAHIDRAAVDGVVLHSVPSRNPTLDLIRRRGTPAVVVDQPGPVPGLGWVGLDEHASMRAVGEHLRRLGHRHVGVVSSRLSTRPYDGPAGSLRRRRSAYEIPRLRTAGLEEGLGRPVRVAERWEVSEDAGADAAAELWRCHPRVTAIVCVADTYALGVLRWARSHHVEVPHHLSVTGFDDAPRARDAGLTTVAQPFALKGRSAAALLLQMVDGEPARAQTLTTSLLVRATTGPPVSR